MSVMPMIRIQVRLGLTLALFIAAAGVGRGTAAMLRPEQDALPTGRQVVGRHVEAVGGVAAFKEIRALHARGRVEISGVGLTGDFELFAARPNRMLYRITVPAIGVVEHGFDGRIGWTLSPLAGPEVLSGRELAESADDAWFDHALYESDYVRSLETLGRVVFDGRAALKVRVVLHSGTEQMEYFDAVTGLAAGSEAERATPQGVVPTTTILREYRRYGRVMHPTVLVQRALGVEQIVTLVSVEPDAVPETVFTMPPAIAALTSPR